MPSRRSFLSALVAVGVLSVVVFVVGLGAPGEAAPPSPAQAAAPPPPALTGVLPHVVPPIPAGVMTPEQARPFFDYFSWQSFIALNWPADPAQRGVASHPDDPAAFQKAFKPNAAGQYPPTVWSTWKQAFELFGQGNNRPSVWTSYQNAVWPCGSAPAGSPPFPVMDADPNDINQAFSSPLVDQAHMYSRYQIYFNDTEYNTIRGDDAQPSTWLYLSNNLANFPAGGFPASTATTYGAIELKACWKPLTAADDKERYYVVMAQVVTPGSNPPACSTVAMGLVGFHIAHKTSPFTQWVWSTFEQVDNVAAGPGPTAGTKPSYNNGTLVPPTPNGYDKATPKYAAGQPLPANPVAVQVTGVTPIPTTPAGQSTVELNAAYQKLVAGTVWANYELIATQWPTDPGTFDPTGSKEYPQFCGSPFPVDGVANTTAETYFQTNANSYFGSSCMHCHYRTATTDFSWALALRAYVPPPPALDPATPAALAAAALTRGADKAAQAKGATTDKLKALRENIAKLRAAKY